MIFDELVKTTKATNEEWIFRNFFNKYGITAANIHENMHRIYIEEHHTDVGIVKYYFIDNILKFSITVENNEYELNNDHQITIALTGVNI